MSEDTEQAQKEDNSFWELNRLRQENQQLKMQMKEMQAARANMDKPFDELREQNAKLIQAVATLARLLEPNDGIKPFFTSVWPE